MIHGNKSYNNNDLLIADIIIKMWTIPSYENLFCFYLWVENLKQKLCKKVSTSNKVNYQVPLF